MPTKRENNYSQILSTTHTYSFAVIHLTRNYTLKLLIVVLCIS